MKCIEPHSRQIFRNMVVVEVYMADINMDTTDITRLYVIFRYVDMNKIYTSCTCILVHFGKHRL